MDHLKKEQVLTNGEAGKKLSNKEYVVWMQIIGHTKIEAETIISIKDNRDPNILID